MLVEDVEVPRRRPARQPGLRHRRGPGARRRPGAIGARLADLPPVDHRLQAVRSASGATILDDTYNSNPAGAAAALQALASAGADAGPTPSGSPAVVVTPGMVELGSRQFEENRAFGAAAAAVANDLVSWAGPTGGPCWPVPARSTAPAVRDPGGRPSRRRRSTGSASTSVRVTPSCTRTICPDHYP